MAEVTLVGLGKVYPNGHVGLADLDLDVADGEVMVLVGPSGCGKSTALRLVAGLETVTSGEIRIGGRVVNDLEPKERDIAMVFQNYALYPHLTVAQNIGFALKLAGVPKAEISERVRQAAASLKLEPWLDRKPGQLSGGQRQRVAMGRAIVRDPAVFLMDEPLSNLDAKLRVEVRAEIAQLQRELGTTTIYVTHDQVEAMTLGDRVAVLNAGRLVQVAPPISLYDEPDDLFVATFIGSPAMSLAEARFQLLADGSARLHFGDDDLELPACAVARRPTLRAFDGRQVVVGMRPEHLADAALDPEAPAGARLRAIVEARELLGAVVDVHLRLGPGDQQADRTVVARFDGRSRADLGAVVEVVVDTERVHLFDPDTGRAIR